MNNYDDNDITAAVQAGVLTGEEANAFRIHLAETNRSKIKDDEQFRLVMGFNDVFVVIACVLLLSSVAWLSILFLSWFGGLVMSLVAWCLGEYFIRRRRMALTSIALVIAYGMGVFLGGIFCLKGFGYSDEIIMATACVITALSAWPHWSRFKVPITITLSVATLFFGLVWLLFELIPEAKPFAAVIIFIIGSIIFMLAMYWDSADVLRQTRKSDVAFWLHIASAPCIAQFAFSFIELKGSLAISLGEASLVIILYLLIAIVSLSIDRRALMVSALSYVLYSFHALLRQYAMVNISFAVTALIIGAGLLLLSVYWQPCRRKIISYYPDWLLNKLPPMG